MKFSFFGVPVVLDFSGESITKYNRYQEISEETDAYDDDPIYYTEDEDSEEHQAKVAKISERVDLWYELLDEGVIDTHGDDEDNPEHQSSGGLLGWLFG